MSDCPTCNLFDLTVVDFHQEVDLQRSKGMLQQVEELSKALHLLRMISRSHNMWFHNMSAEGLFPEGKG